MERARAGWGKTGGGGREWAGGRRERRQTLTRGSFSQKHSFYLLRITVLRWQSSLLYFILVSYVFISYLFCIFLSF